MLRELLNNFFVYRKRKTIKKKVTLSGNCYDKYFVVRGTTVNLCDGSSPKDIILGERVWLWGSLNSQNGGKISIGDYTQIGMGCKINAVESVTIGRYVTFAPNVTVDDNNNHPVSPQFRKYMRIAGDLDSSLWKYSNHASVVIGDNCWIGRNVSILKGVIIGENSVIGANSVVTKNVPANCLAVGNPAKVVKTGIEKIPAPTNCEGYNEYIKQMQNASAE